jgi:hypothetical protein
MRETSKVRHTGVRQYPAKTVILAKPVPGLNRDGDPVINVPAKAVILAHASIQSLHGHEVANIMLHEWHLLKPSYS